MRVVRPQEEVQATVDQLSGLAALSMVGALSLRAPEKPGLSTPGRSPRGSPATPSKRRRPPFQAEPASAPQDPAAVPAVFATPAPIPLPGAGQIAPTAAGTGSLPPTVAADAATAAVAASK